jgi:predicted GNAT family acetyltransferase
MNWNYETGRVYSVDENGELMAETTFVATGDKTVEIDHTFVNPALRGQGVAGKMMETVAAHLRENGLKATASCSYASAWLDKHRESYADVIAGDIDR